MTGDFELSPSQEQINLLSAQLFRQIHRHASAKHPGTKAYEAHDSLAGEHDILFYSQIHGTPVIVSISEIRRRNGLETSLSVEDLGDNRYNNSSVDIDLRQDADGNLRPHIRVAIPIAGTYNRQRIDLTSDPSANQPSIEAILEGAVNFLDTEALPIDNSQTPEWLS